MTAASEQAHAEIVSHHDKVLIVDFGSQVTQLIARRVREAGVYCEIAPFQSAQKAFDELKPKAVILSGGPASVTAEGSPRAPQAIFDAGLPILSICYGQQTTAVQLGGVVEGGHAAEFGRLLSTQPAGIDENAAFGNARQLLEFLCYQFLQKLGHALSWGGPVPIVISSRPGPSWWTRWRAE